MSVSTRIYLFMEWTQGKGAYGSVVKARNKIDSRIYAGMLSFDSFKLLMYLSHSSQENSFENYAE